MFEKIRDIIADQLKIDPAEIRDDVRFKDDLEIDSLDLYEVVMALEEEYDLEFPQDDLENFETIKDIMDYLASKGIDQ